jgi:hypothetical protein
MKIKTIAYALLVTVGLASCTAESSAPNTIENATFSLEKKFNARSVVFEENGKNDLNLNELEPVNIDEANTILNTLRNHTDLKEECSLKETAGKSGDTILTICTEQCIDNLHKLTLLLEMISYKEDGSLYYKGYNAFASSSLYKWHMDGFVLSSSSDLEGLYNFECTSSLYFKVVNDGIHYIKVPIKVNGKYDPNTHKVDFTYIF